MIDTHVHVWDPAGGPFDVDYPWLTPVLGDLYRAYGLANVDSSMIRTGVDGVVLVQAADSINETTALLAVARGCARPAAVVGWLLPGAGRPRRSALVRRQPSPPQSCRSSC